MALGYLDTLTDSLHKSCMNSIIAPSFSLHDRLRVPKMAKYLGIGWLCMFYCRIALIIASSPSPTNGPQKVTIGMVIEKALDFFKRSDTHQSATSEHVLPATNLARVDEQNSDADEDQKGRQLFRLPPSAKINSLYNPLLLYPGWGMSYFYIWPAVVAMSLGFIWPFYEYLRTGHTYYHPGYVFDKDFTEFTKWYFKHQIYKKKYWNLDGYLARYFEAHNDALQTFFEIRDVPERQLIEYAEQLGVRPKVLDEGKNVTDVEPKVADGNSTKKVEQVLDDMVNQMLEDNSDLKAFLANSTADGGHQKIRDVMKTIIQRSFGSNETHSGESSGTKVGSIQRSPSDTKAVHHDEKIDDFGDLTAYAAYKKQNSQNGITTTEEPDPDTETSAPGSQSYSNDYFTDIFHDLYSKYYGNEKGYPATDNEISEKKPGRRFMSRSGQVHHAKSVVAKNRMQRRSMFGDEQMKKLRRLARVKGGMQNRRRNNRGRNKAKRMRNIRNRRTGEDSERRPGFLSILYHVVRHRFGLEN